jgi:hypothetical protein
VALRITDPELFGVTESSFSPTFRVLDGAGNVAAPGRVPVYG